MSLLDWTLGLCPDVIIGRCVMAFLASAISVISGISSCITEEFSAVLEYPPALNLLIFFKTLLGGDTFAREDWRAEVGGSVDWSMSRGSSSMAFVVVSTSFWLRLVSEAFIIFT